MNVDDRDEDRTEYVKWIHHALTHTRMSKQSLSLARSPSLSDSVHLELGSGRHSGTPRHSDRRCITGAHVNATMRELCEHVDYALSVPAQPIPTVSNVSPQTLASVSASAVAAAAAASAAAASAAVLVVDALCPLRRQLCPVSVRKSKPQDQISPGPFMRSSCVCTLCVCVYNDN